MTLVDNNDNLSKRKERMLRCSSRISWTSLGFGPKLKRLKQKSSRFSEAALDRPNGPTLGGRLHPVADHFKLHFCYS